MGDYEHISYLEWVCPPAKYQIPICGINTIFEETYTLLLDAYHCTLHHAECTSSSDILYSSRSWREDLLRHLSSTGIYCVSSDGFRINTTDITTASTNWWVVVYDELPTPFITTSRGHLMMSNPIRKSIVCMGLPILASSRPQINLVLGGTWNLLIGSGLVCWPTVSFCIIQSHWSYILLLNWILDNLLKTAGEKIIW